MNHLHLNAVVTPADNHLPARYREPWFEPWDARLKKAYRPGMSILDLGSGRRPAIAPDSRPANCRYVGLDLSEAELARSPAGSYDEVVVADATERVPQLEGRFDLVVSYQVLEHVNDLVATVENLRRYLVPGGTLVAQLSGRYSAFGLINLVLPSKLGATLVERLLPREKGTVFPAYYDRCSDRGLRGVFKAWQDLEIMPRYNGAVYFSFFRPLEKAYLSYENWAERRGHRNLATHYLVSARR